MNTTKVFKNHRLIQALTGISTKEFQSLIPVFEQSVLEDKKLQSKAKQRHFGGGAKGKLITAEDKLFFILVYIKTYPTFDFLGFVFSMHRSRAHRNAVKLTKSLEKTLGRKIVMPEKQITSMEEFLDKFPEAKISLWTESVALWVDTGFQGVLKQHINTLIPKKGTKKKPLTHNEKEENRVISSFRVVVEHAIAGIKRFKAYADIWRNKIAGFDDQVMRIACGLWNLHLEIGCYLYISNGVNYTFMAHQTVETFNPDSPVHPLDRPCCVQQSIAVYSSKENSQ